MKAVAAHPFLVPAVRDREPVGDLGMAAMERGVEAGDLGHLRRARADRRIGARLFGWCSGARGTSRSSRSSTASSTRIGAVEIRAAMDDAVADRARGRRRAGRAATPRAGQRRAHVRYLGGG